MRFAALLLCALPLCAQQLRLDPKNPHYFEYQGKTIVLIGSTEHYGAVLNGAFDYRKYLDTLAADRLNLTRTFSGLYREVPGSFNIARNTLAPDPANFITPYATADGKYDLARWNDAYFQRLRDFVAVARQRGVIVEFTLFCTFYEDQLWDLSPLNPKNTVQAGPPVPRTEVFTMKHPTMVAVHDSFVRKVVGELRDADNVFFEIINEPYFAGVSPEWQRHISSVIAATESGSAKPHLIAQNIANDTATIENPDPNVSIFNFHYARPPVAVAANYGLNKPIGYDETGFDGPYDSTYRVQAWDFLIAGGSTFDHLDYSFTAGTENGTFDFPMDQPGGGTPRLRKQLRTLHEFLGGFDLAAMKPDASAISSGVPENGTSRVLSAPGEAYAVYIHHGRRMPDYRPQYVVGTAEHNITLVMRIEPARYLARWWNPRTGKVEKEERFEQAAGLIVLAAPPYREDIALELKRIR